MNAWMRLATDTLVVAILACLPGSAQPVDAPALQKGPITLSEAVLLPATLPVQRWGGGAESLRTGIPTVIVSLNDSPVEHAAIGTGLDANVVSPDTSQKLKLAAIAGRVKVDVLDCSAVAGQVEMQRFRAATLDLPKLAFAVADVPKMLSPNLRADPPAIWLGTPFLSAFQVTLDLGANSLTLKKATTVLPRPRGTSVVPLVFRENRPYVRVTIPGAKPFLALIDTTSPGTMIPTEVGEKLKLKPMRVETISWHDGKPGKVAVVAIPKLSIGNAEWKSARVIYLTSESSKEYNRTFAVLGMDFVAQFRITLDFAHSQVALATPEKPTDKAPRGGP